VQLSAEHPARLFKQHTGETEFEHLDHLGATIQTLRKKI